MDYVNRKKLIFFAILLTAGLNSWIFSAGIQKLKIHVVRNGENISAIAKRYNMSMSSILLFNKIENPDRIIPGQILKLYYGNIDDNHSVHPELEISDISLSRPVSNWTLIKSFKSYGEIKNYGLLCNAGKFRIVKSAQDGKVVKIAYLRGYGRYILIDHGKGWHTLYSNISDEYVKEGDLVKSGSDIGKLKSEIIYFVLSYKGKPVNPEGYFKRN